MTLFRNTLYYQIITSSSKKDILCTSYYDFSFVGAVPTVLQNSRTATGFFEMPIVYSGSSFEIGGFLCSDLF